MTIGWYVHHHGSGHLQRFLAVRERLPGVVGLSSLPRPPGLPAADWVRLAPDVPADAADDPAAGGALHWAPLRHHGLRSRMAAIAGWVQRSRPAAFVVDVSVEVALAVRLLGVPVVWIAQRGRRTDDPHRLAYRIATVLVPWTAALDSAGSGLPDGAVRVGAVSRFDGRVPPPAPGRRRVAVLVGRGGHAIDGAQLRAAARATPQWSWTAVGLDAPAGEPVRDGGRPDDPWPILCGADVVIGAAGSNTIAEVAAARRPFVCLPQRRPFGEQDDAAEALRRAGLAETLAGWPDAGRWPAILERAGRRDPERWAILHDGGAATRLAQEIRRVAAPAGG